ACPCVLGSPAPDGLAVGLVVVGRGRGVSSGSSGAGCVRGRRCLRVSWPCVKGIDPVTGSYGRADASSSSASAGSTALLDRPSDPEFSSDPRITREDILAVLGPDADAMMAEANVGVDELIQLINAETTMLPPIVDTGAATAATASADAGSDDTDDSLGSAVRTWKKRFLKGSVLAMLITLTGGGAAALAMNK